MFWLNIDLFCFWYYDRMKQNNFFFIDDSLDLWCIPRSSEVLKVILNLFEGQIEIILCLWASNLSMGIRNISRMLLFIPGQKQEEIYKTTRERLGALR